MAQLLHICPGMHVSDEKHYAIECPAFKEGRKEINSSLAAN